jgi:peptide/nickel transport system substrate-binding protein
MSLSSWSSPFRPSRRSLLKSLSLGLALTASTGTIATAQETPTPGGSMVVTLGANPDHLNPAISSSVIVAMPAQPMIEGLVRLDGEFLPQPVLAESWSVSEDSKTFTFTLRQGVTWHDGEAFTADDVAFTLSTITPLHPRAASVFANVASVEATDDHTVVVTLTEPFGPFVNFLTADNVGILPEHIYAGSDPMTNPANLAPIGTGPFKFEEWAPGQSITLAKNENYWAEGRPYLDSLIFSIIPDANSRILALEAGDVDMVTNYDISINDIERLKQTPGIVVRQSGGIPRPLLLIFNTEVEALQSPAVRKALFRGLDREMIQDSAYAGEGELGRSAVPPGIAWAYDPSIDYMQMFVFDTEAANAELDAAGFPRGADGKRFTVRFTYDPAQGGFAEIGEIMRANWADLGVDVVLEARERNVWLDLVYQQKNFDTTVAFYLAGIDPAFGVDRAYRCADIRPASFTNASQYCNEELDAQLNGARTTTNLEERIAFYRRAQEIIAQDLPTAVIMDSPHAQAISDQFGNLDLLFEFSNEVNARFSEVYFKQ